GHHGKRKSAKPQKYIQPSEDEDEDNVDFYNEMEESENILSNDTSISSEKYSVPVDQRKASRAC
ncbi:hypothetical protein CEXT_118301, partial [Caerostris extrusa]